MQNLDSVCLKSNYTTKRISMSKMQEFIELDQVWSITQFQLFIKPLKQTKYGMKCSGLENQELKHF